MSDKTDLRREHFAALKKLSLGDRNRATQKISTTLACMPAVKSSRLIAAYVALKSEPNLMPLLKAPPHPDGSIAIPRVTASDELEFRLLTSTDQLVRGSHGIFEPDPEHCPLVEAADIDLVLTPGVAFDPCSFARLGRGKGHYDRFIAKLRVSRPEPAPVIGVAFQIQLVQVPSEQHDEPMDALVTETGFRQTPVAADTTG